MKGWKTWAGAALIGVGAALKAMGYEQYAEIVLALGAALGLVGVGHKLEKSKQ